MSLVSADDNYTPPCLAVDESIVEKEKFLEKNIEHLSKLDNTEWRSSNEGLHLSSWPEGGSVLTVYHVAPHNFFKVTSTKFGDSQWLWIDKGASCLLDVDFWSITGGKLYKQQ